MPAKVESKEITIDTIIEKDKFYVLKHGDDGYFVWDAPLKALIRDGTVREGMAIQILFEPGKYPKVTKIQLLAGPPSGVTEGGEEGYSEPEIYKIEKQQKETQREENIQRSVALYAAVDCMPDFMWQDDTSIYVDQVVQIADKLLEWLKGGTHDAR